MIECRGVSWEGRKGEERKEGKGRCWDGQAVQREEKTFVLGLGRRKEGGR